MGRFKRKKSLPRVRKKALESLHEKIPDKWLHVYSVARRVFETLKKEGKIKTFTTLGSQTSDLSCSFEVVFSFWHRLRNINFFISENPKRCSIQQSDLDSFNVLIGREVQVAELVQQFQDWIDISQSGLKFEDRIVADLNTWFLSHDPSIFIRKATKYEDQKEKKDVFVVSENFSVGIQVKTDVKNWVKHRREYSSVPSILIPKDYAIDVLVEKILFIFDSFKEGTIEHVNMC